MRVAKDFKFLSKKSGEVANDFQGNVYCSESNVVSANALKVSEDVFTGKVYTIKTLTKEYTVLDDGFKLLTSDGYKTLQEIRREMPNLMTYHVDVTDYGKAFLRISQRVITNVIYRSVEDMPCKVLDTNACIVDTLKFMN